MKAKVWGVSNERVAREREREKDVCVCGMG